MALYSRELLDHEIKAAAPLSRAEERALVIQAQTGRTQRIRRAAVTRLLRGVLRLLWRDAHRFAHRFGGDPMDLLQEAVVGVLYAVSRFKVECGTRLATYVSWWARSAMQMHVVKQRDVVQRATTAHSRAMLFQLPAIEASAQARTGTVPTDYEIARRFKTTIERVRTHRPRHQSYGEVSLDYVGENGAPLVEVFRNGDVPVDEQLARLERGAMLRGMVARLPPKMRHVIEARWLEPERGGHAAGHRDGSGTLCPANVGLRALSPRLGLSGERIRQIEKQAFAQLRAMWREAQDQEDRDERKTRQRGS